MNDVGMQQDYHLTSEEAKEPERWITRFLNFASLQWLGGNNVDAEARYSAGQRPGH